MLTAILVAQGIAILLLGVLVVGLLRSHGDVLRRLHRLDAGTGTAGPGGASAARTGPADGSFATGPADLVLASRPAPATHVSGRTLDGDAVSLAVGSGRDVLLAFLSGGCESCLPFWEAIREGAPVPGGAELVVVAQGAERESASLLRRLAPQGVPLVLSSEAWEDYDVPGSPHLVYLDGATGAVTGEGTAGSWDQVVSMLQRALDDRRQASAAGAGVPASGQPRGSSARTDVELAAAGVGAGDPRLYADPSGAARQEDRG